MLSYITISTRQSMAGRIGHRKTWLSAIRKELFLSPFPQKSSTRYSLAPIQTCLRIQKSRAYTEVMMAGKTGLWYGTDSRIASASQVLPSIYARQTSCLLPAQDM